MAKQIRLIDKHTNSGVFDMMGFTEELASMPCRDQLRTAQEITASHAPLDYAKPTTHEGIVADNPDLIGLS